MTPGTSIIPPDSRRCQSLEVSPEKTPGDFQARQNVGLGSHRRELWAPRRRVHALFSHLARADNIMDLGSRPGCPSPCPPEGHGGIKVGGTASPLEISGSRTGLLGCHRYIKDPWSVLVRLHQVLGVCHRKGWPCYRDVCVYSLSKYL
jgi:hypothetical protein